MPKACHAREHGPKPKTLEAVIERFWSRVNFLASDLGCWEWTGGHTKLGYGQFQARGLADQPIYTHRFSWEYFFGPLPKGAHVLHVCDNPPCVMPWHLFLGDQSINNYDMIFKERMKIGGNWRRFLDA